MESNTLKLKKKYLITFVAITVDMGDGFCTPYPNYRGKNVKVCKSGNHSFNTTLNPYIEDL
jgi:hypothetical protein